MCGGTEICWRNPRNEMMTDSSDKRSYIPKNFLYKPCITDLKQDLTPPPPPPHTHTHTDTPTFKLLVGADNGLHTIFLCFDISMDPKFCNSQFSDVLNYYLFFFIFRGWSNVQVIYFQEAV